MKFLGVHLGCLNVRILYFSSQLPFPLFWLVPNSVLADFSYFLHEHMSCTIVRVNVSVYPDRSQEELPSLCLHEFGLKFSCKTAASVLPFQWKLLENPWHLKEEFYMVKVLKSWECFLCKYSILLNPIWIFF